jgi:hypothetical protein
MQLKTVRAALRRVLVGSGQISDATCSEPLIHRRTGMKNIKMTVYGSRLVIEVDLKTEFGPSKSGKTTIVASTEGPERVPSPEFADVRVGLNVYRQK